MNLQQLRELAGIKRNEDEILLDEAIEIPENITLEEVNKMFDAAKKALGLANKLRDPDEKKKHMSQVMSGLNKIRAAVQKLSKQQ
jgi:hypothetical protein